jgi:hypothetical protein
MSVLRTALALSCCVLVLAVAHSTLAQPACESQSVYELGKECDRPLDQRSPFALPPLWVDGSSVINDRQPRAPKLPEGMPQQCRTLVSDRLDRWRKDDVCDWKRLSDEYCSHLSGWRLKDGQTCSAGGPPPKCVQDHWLQDPGAALATLRREQERLQRNRRLELNQAVNRACECWATRLDKETGDKSWTYTEDIRVREGPGASRLLAACSALGCPPGLTCFKDRCLPRTAFDSVTEIAIQQADDKATDQAAKLALKVVLVNKHLAGFVVGMLDPLPTGLQHSVYDGPARDFIKTIDVVAPLLRELNESLVDPKPGRPAATIRSELQAAMKSLNSTFDVLDSVSQASLSDMRPEQCPAVFGARHRRLAATYAQFRALVPKALD